jgi:hypothetical protein
MTVQQIRRYLSAAPFRPFAVYLADGRICSVMHPDLLLLSSSGRTADIYSDLHSFETVDCLLIVSLRAYSEVELRRPFSR